MARKPSPKPKHVAHSRPAKPKSDRPLSASHTPLEELDKLRATFQSAVAPYVPEKLPSKPRNSYNSDICEIVIAKAELGHTLGATCAFIGCSRTSLHDWAASHPELANAVARAKIIRQQFYEGHLIDIARRGGDSTRMSAIKLALLNVAGEDWKERLTAEHNVTFNLGDLIKQSMQLEAKTIEGQVIEPSKSDDGETLD